MSRWGGAEVFHGKLPEKEGIYTAESEGGKDIQIVDRDGKNVATVTIEEE